MVSNVGIVGGFIVATWVYDISFHLYMLLYEFLILFEKIIMFFYPSLTIVG